MATTIKGFHRGSLRSFAPILNEWIKANSEIACEWRSVQDAPWWYNERASLSVFAGAIWRARGFAFEEYSDQKREIRKRTGTFGAEYPGRVDLYFSWAGYDFVAEAKFVWCGFSRNDNGAMRRPQDRLSRACSDIRQTPARGQRRLGIVFAMPYFREDYIEQLDDRIHRWIDHLADLDATAYAWVFPACTRTLRGRDKTYCPGAAVVIREI